MVGPVGLEDVSIYMILITSLDKIKSLGSKDLIELQCEYCSKTFKKAKNYYLAAIKGNPKVRLKHCSKNCSNNSKVTRKKVKCKTCNVIFLKLKSQILKSSNHFCSRSCSATYTNKHKKFGIRRSKLEVWLEQKLQKLYPELDFRFNKKDAIGSELDIYIPSLKLAFELNGIFHYEPIFGSDKLGQIQDNDLEKIKACGMLNIKLVILDVSKLQTFKVSEAIYYLNIIKSLIGRA